MTSRRRPRRSTSAPNCSSSSSVVTVAVAWRRSAIVSNSGTSERSSPTSSRVSASARRRSSGPAVPETMIVSSAREPWRARAARHRPERLVQALVGGGELIGVHADVELRDVEAEQLDAAAQVGELAVRDARAAVGAEARVHQLEIEQQAVGVVVGGLAGRGEQVLEAPADEAELAPVGLVEVLVADLGGEGRELALVARDRSEQLVAHRHHARRDAGRPRELAHLAAVAADGEPSRALEPLRHRVRPGLRVAVLIAADPGAEAERRPGSGQPLAVLREHVGGDVEQRRLEEPERVTDLVDHARPARAHLVGLPERGDLGDDAVLEPPPPGRRERGVVECLERAAEVELRLQHRAASGLRGMGRDHELERDRVGPAHQVGRRDAALGEPAEGVGERLARDSLLALVAAPAADAMPGLGDVGELEVEPEGAQDRGRALVAERPHVPGERGVILRRAGFASRAGELPDALDIGQQLLAVLLHEHPPERIADEPHVTPQGGVAPVSALRGGIVGAGAAHPGTLRPTGRAVVRLCRSSAIS